MKEVFSHQDKERQLMMEWQAYAGESASSIYKVLLEDIDLSRPDYALIHIRQQRSKTGFAHDCIVPAGLARVVIESAKSAARKSPFPNHERLWKEVTEFAKEKYSVYLHSHYLRKRFQTIAEQTPMPHNHYSILMGEKPKQGHDPSIYSLATQTAVLGDQLVEEYDKYLVKNLKLSVGPDPW